MILGLKGFIEAKRRPILMSVVKAGSIGGELYGNNDELSLDKASTQLNEAKETPLLLTSLVDSYFVVLR